MANSSVKQHRSRTRLRSHQQHTSPTTSASTRSTPSRLSWPLRRSSASKSRIRTPIPSIAVRLPYLLPHYGSTSAPLLHLPPLHPLVSPIAYSPSDICLRHSTRSESNTNCYLYSRQGRRVHHQPARRQLNSPLGRFANHPHPHVP